MIVVLTDGAEAELEAIGDWIAKDAPARAITFVGELRDACEKLGKRPNAFSLLHRHKESGIRKRTYGNYLIFYRVTDCVNVIHILHGARDYERILFPE